MTAPILQLSKGSFQKVLGPGVGGDLGLLFLAKQSVLEPSQTAGFLLVLEMGTRVPAGNEPSSAKWPLGALSLIKLTLKQEDNIEKSIPSKQKYYYDIPPISHTCSLIGSF